MVEIFLDTANIDEIKEITSWNIISGITTNQKIFLKEKGVNFKDHINAIIRLGNYPLSIELTNTSGTDNDLINEATTYAQISSNIVIKVPMWKDGKGLRIVKNLKENNIKTNMTCLMTSNQVLLATKAGATYASIFYNRIKDAEENPNKIISESKYIIDNSDENTKIIVGSIRRPSDVTEAYISGADIVTIPYKIMKQLPWHWKTEESIIEFDNAWSEFMKQKTNEN